MGGGRRKEESWGGGWIGGEVGGYGSDVGGMGRGFEEGIGGWEIGECMDLLGGGWCGGD